MDSRDNAIKTTEGTIWLQDGILIQRMTDVRSTLETVDETFRVFSDLSGSSRRPFLFDVRKWQGGDPEAWNLAIQKTASTFSAVAILVDADSASVAGSFPDAVNQFLIPAQTFTNEEEALAFLRNYLSQPDEQGTPPN